jgi:hypothetical protein
MQILANQLEGKLLKRELISEEAVELHRLVPWAVAKQSGSHSKSSGLGSTPVDAKWCPPRLKPPAGSYYWPPVSEAEVADAEEVLSVESELLANTESKERFLVASKTSISEKNIAFKFGMDDRNVDAAETAENVKMVEEDMKRTDLQTSEIEMKMRDFVSVL